MLLDKLAKDIYEQNKVVGWWDDPNRCIFQTIQLFSTEVAEATEGERKNLMDDHLPHRKMGEVELADALIRVLDVGGRFNFNFTESKIDNLDHFSHEWCSEDGSIGKQHLGINAALIHFATVYDDFVSNGGVFLADLLIAYDRLICSILKVGNNQGYDILSALKEKLEYNKNRADHKRENRNKENGKKF